MAKVANVVLICSDVRNQFYSVSAAMLKHCEALCVLRHAVAIQGSYNASHLIRHPAPHTSDHHIAIAQACVLAVPELGVSRTVIFSGNIELHVCTSVFCAHRPILISAALFGLNAYVIHLGNSHLGNLMLGVHQVEAERLRDRDVSGDSE